MRAKEFINEQDRDVSGENYFGLPLPTAVIIPNSSQNFYHMYRFGIAMSKAPDQNINIDDETSRADKLAIVPYSDGDMDIIKRAGKTMNAPPEYISSKGTKEENGGNTVSPVVHNTGKRKK